MNYTNKSELYTILQIGVIQKLSIVWFSCNLQVNYNVHDYRISLQGRIDRE